MILKKTKGAKGMSFYRSDDGKDYVLRQVDRRYPGRKNPPVFFLEQVLEGRRKYLSGLFPTKQAGVYSLDLQDEKTGFRMLFNATFQEGGELLVIEPKKQKEAKCSEKEAFYWTGR